MHQACSIISSTSFILVVILELYHLEDPETEEEFNKPEEKEKRCNARNLQYLTRICNTRK